MNPPNPFGSPQGGAFQAPSSSMKTGLFQAPTQGINFFQPSAFGQPPAINQQPSGQRSSMFGQAPAFGQSSSQPAMNQAPAFRQPSLGVSTTGFGTVTTAAFVQPPGPGQSSIFGQPSAFGQAPGFGHQAPSFGKQPPVFGLQPSRFGNPQMTTSSTSTTTLGQAQPLSFGQPAFGLPSSTSIFGATQSVTQSRGFGSSEFNFKPANEAVFKPIFSASPEPALPHTTSLSVSSFGSSTSQISSNTMSSTTTSGFSLPVRASSGPLGFSFSQPAAAPSLSAQSNLPSTGDSTSQANTPRFTFSQPAVPSSSNTKTTEPTTPSSFSFTAKSLQPQPALLFGGTPFSQPAAFGDAKVDMSSGEKESSQASLAETNVFARLGKTTKRKEDGTVSSTSSEKPSAEVDVAAEADLLRQPAKRPLMRSRFPIGGLFGRALSGIRKEDSKPLRKEPTKETHQATLETQEAQTEEFQAEAEVLPVAPSTLPEPVRQEEKTSEASEVSEPQVETTPPARRGRRESSESLSGLCPSDFTVIQCRNIPPGLSKKDILFKHFSRFGKVQKVLCRPNKNTALIYFNDHVSAAEAKKRGKVLQNHELLLLWNRKKQSPGERGRRPAEGMEEQKLEDTGTSATSSPLRRATLRPSLLDNPVAFSRSSPVKKPPLVKALQFHAEPQRDISSEPDATERPVPSSLHHLIGLVAETSEEKYRLLEQRDKVLRQDRPKRTDLDLSKVFVGTCPDMCPEKERYMRETRKQLSVYEVIPNTEMVDHAAAIKEYSRSSADQEEPLPHELRPLAVLSMTMDYLVTQIMDQGHDNYRDWYDFVWNRTRGIRKDITQQHLCCPATVSLIEKCTRFHVHCGHDLCEEQLSSFDAKINSENMTKCLQSLKEMYEDLATQQVFCPREAEFRQYSVLLKLNDGDILREVQQFREEVRNSAEVKFAVQAFAAVNSNNFVRFFKLVKRASYLASCLLHRYFHQVRGKALKTLNHAHTVGPRSTAFPVDDIARMLMFRNTSEATDFIQQFGLNVNDGMVELSRISYQEPDLPLSQVKCEEILAKKATLIGEVVNGGPLPNIPHILPVCSFDSQHKYMGDALLPETSSTQFKTVPHKVEVQDPPIPVLQTQAVPVAAPDVPTVFGYQEPTSAETGEPCQSFKPPNPPAETVQPLMPTKPQPSKPPSPPPPQPEYSSEDIMAEVDTMVEEVVDTAVRDLADACVSYTAAALEESSSQVEVLLEEVLGQMLEEVSLTEITLEQERVAEEERKLEEARRKREHEAFLTEFGFTFCREVVDEVIGEIVQETASSQIQEAVDEKAERVAVCTDQVCTELMEETLSTDIALLVEDVLDVELQRIHKYIKRWRDVVAVRRQLKRQMRGFPAAPCCVDPRFKLKALAPSAPSHPSIADLTRGFVNLGNAGMLALSSTRLLRTRRAVIHQMRVHYFYQLLLEEKVWAPLNLPAILTEQIPNPAHRIFWKAVLLLPSDHESVASEADRILSDWLEVKFGGNRSSEGREEQPDGVMKTLNVTNSLQERAQHTHTVHISIKASRGPLSEDGLLKVEEGCELQGVGALLLLLPALSLTEAGKEEQDVPLLSALLQLKQLQQATSCLCPLPLVILVPGSDRGDVDTHNLEEALLLQTLTEEGLISEYIFLFIPETTSDLQGTKQLSQAMSWLLARAPPPPPLLCQTLVQLMEGALNHMFTPRVAAHCQQRVEACLPSQDPAPVIQLYNALVVHVAERVSSEELSKFSWPPGEFCLPETQAFVPPLGWNAPEHLAWLQETILSLQLPEWEHPSDTDSWSEVCSSIFRYAAKLKVSNLSQPLLMSQLENLLERVRVKTLRSQVSLRSPRGAAGSLSSAYNRIPWDEMLLICMDHKLRDWHLASPPICEDVMTEDGEVLVYFLPDSLKNFQPPEEWDQAVRKTHREKHQEQDGVSAASSSSSPPTTHSIRQRLFHSRMEPTEATTAPLDITHTLSPPELLAHKLLQSSEDEKRESKRSLDQLQRWMEGEPLDALTTPLFIPSSTLLSMPTTIIHTRTRDTAALNESEELSQAAVQMKTPPQSISWRLMDLQRQILASQEEELACKMELSGLLSIVDD